MLDSKGVTMADIAVEIAERELPGELEELLGVERDALLEYGALCFQLGLRLGRSCRVASFEQGEGSYKVALTDYCEHCLYQVRLIEQGTKSNGQRGGEP